MNFNDYQQAAVSTAIYPEDARVTYTTLGLVGEAGEVAEKVKKIIRSGRPISEMTESEALEIAKELGDVLWYAANLAGSSRGMEITVSPENNTYMQIQMLLNKETK